MEKNKRKTSDVQQNQVKACKAAQETVVKRRGYCRGGRRRVESEKETHKSTRGMFLLRLLSMERAHSIKSRHV